MRRLPVLLLAVLLAGCTISAQGTGLGFSPLPQPQEPAAWPTVIIWPTGRLPMPIFEANQAASVAEAQERVRFTIAVPSVLPAGYERVWVGTSPRSVDDPDDLYTYSRLVYSNGQNYVIINQVLRPEGPPPLAESSSGRCQNFTIRDHPAHGCERQMREVPISGTDRKATLLTTARLEWWPPGQRRIILLDEMNLHLTLTDLVAIAESMEPAE